METAFESRYLTLEETMAILRVSRSTVYRMVNRGELPGYKIAKRWMFDRGEVAEFVAVHRYTANAATVTKVDSATLASPS
jgi:excisionase family DNA binding protein